MRNDNEYQDDDREFIKIDRNLAAVVLLGMVLLAAAVVVLTARLITIRREGLSSASEQAQITGAAEGTEVVEGAVPEVGEGTVNGESGEITVAPTENATEAPTEQQNEDSTAQVTTGAGATYTVEELDPAELALMSGKERTYAVYTQAVNLLVSADPQPENLVDWNKIVIFGDSLTEGTQSGEDTGMVKWPDTLAMIYGVETVENNAIGGSTIWSGGTYPIVKWINNASDGADAVFVMAGINDWFFGTKCQRGSIDQPGTFAGDMEVLCQEIETKYPGAEVFFVMPLDTDQYLGVIEPENPDFTLQNIREVETEVAGQHGFHVIDLTKENILSEADASTKEAYYSDSVHLNTIGYELLGRMIAARAYVLMTQ